MSLAHAHGISTHATAVHLLLLRRSNQEDDLGGKMRYLYPSFLQHGTRAMRRRDLTTILRRPSFPPLFTGHFCHEVCPPNPSNPTAVSLPEDWC